ncbi:MAG TPA: amidohydrolase family protein, partial [Burkholderiaceae bacterium]
MRFLTTLALALACTHVGAEALLIHNARGLTLDERGQVQRFEALAVGADGRVVATGKLAAIEAKVSGARRIDAKGMVLMPGLIDAHGHFLELGLARLSLSLTDTPDLAAALAAVKAYAAQRPDATWLLGRGWNQAIWKLGRFPTAAELDSVEATRPVWLSRVDGHAGWANRRALQIAGITRDTQDPPGGRIERDAAGEPTGVLVDGAMDLVERHVPAPSRNELIKALELAQDELVSLGLTGIH